MRHGQPQFSKKRSYNEKKGWRFMHDLKFAHSILEAVRTAVGDGDSKVPIVADVFLSSFSHVTPQRLKDTFSILSKAEGFTNIKLNVNTFEFCIHCRKCGNTWKSAKPTFKCPKCDSADFEIEEWDEFYIDSIKIDRRY